MTFLSKPLFFVQTLALALVMPLSRANAQVPRTDASCPIGDLGSRADGPGQLGAHNTGDTGDASVVLGNGLARHTLGLPIDLRKAMEVEVHLDRPRLIRLWPEPTITRQVVSVSGEVSDYGVYRGRVVDWPDSVVAASLLPEGLHATILRRSNGEVWSLSPDTGPRAGVTSPGHQVVEWTVPATWPPRGTTNSSTVLEAVIALDLDYLFFIDSGGTETAALERAFGIVNQASMLLEYYCGRRLVLASEHIVHTDPAVHDVPTAALLVDVQAEWNSQHTGIERDLVHHLNGRDGNEGTGLALNNICHLAPTYSWSRDLQGPSLFRVLIATHEIAHQLGANHCCSQQGDCGIMCGGCSENWTCLKPFFGAGAQADIAAFPCGLPIAAPAPIISVTQVTPQAAPVLGAELQLSGTNLDQVVLIDIDGLVLDLRGFDVVNEAMILTSAELDTATAFGPATVTVEGPGGPSAADFAWVECGGYLDGPEYPTAGTLATWRFCGPLDRHGEIWFARSGATEVVDGFQVLKYPIPMPGGSGMIGDPAFTDALGRGAFAWSVPLLALPFRSQFVVHDALGTIVGASDILVHTVQ